MALLLLPTSAFAYIDPNAGGLLYQILFPVIVAIGALWAGFRHKLSYLWWRLRGRPDARKKSERSDSEQP